ncbi:MAG: extracellular solute-binding protein family 1 [Clostridia bacterium]|jgi:raffinose/stachyose/melibiose transport system substrate-binding protein|nr:extracellular solute-binding protein family 1 [Clostridia bacterium]
MKKFLSAVLMLTMSLSVFAGCAKSEETPAPDAAKPASTEAPAAEEKDKNKDITLTVMTSQGWAFPAEDMLTQKFEEETGIKVDLQVVPADQYHDLLKAKLTSGEGPDIFYAQTNEFQIKTATVDPEKYCIDFSDAAWKNVMPKTRIPAVSYNDKLYGLMLWYDSPEFVYIYNKTLFEEAGIKEAPKTYEAFKAACEAIKAKGITPIYEYGAAGWHHQLPFFQIGPRYEELQPGLYKGLNDNTIKFADSKDMQKALDQINEFVQNGYYGDDYMSNDGTDKEDRIANRQAAMIQEGPAFIETIKQKYPEVTDEFGVFLVPFIDNQNYPTNPSGPAIFGYKESKNVEAVKQYFDFLTKPENLQIKLDNTSEWTNIDIAIDGVEQHFTDIEKAFKESIPREKYEIAPVLQTGTKYTNDQWMETGKDMISMFMGELTSKQVLENIDERRAKLAKSQNDPAWQ